MVNWVDVVGPAAVAALAKDASVTLTPGIVTLLERFGQAVEHESRTRHVRQRKQHRVQAELRTAHEAVVNEIVQLRSQYTVLNDDRHFCVKLHPETRLPIVKLEIQTVPTLFVHVGRTYASSPAITFGLATLDYCSGPLTGQVAQAAARLTHFCRTQEWRVSVSALVSRWVDFVRAIHREDRIACEFAHESHMQRRRRAQELRVRGKWRPKKVIEKACTTQPSGALTEHTARKAIEESQPLLDGVGMKNTKVG